MKIRLGFVSNSSSSSFTCDVCNKTYSGWDACPSEFNHQDCVEGHTFCDAKMCNIAKFIALREKGEETDWDKAWAEDPKCYENYEKYGLIDDYLYEVPVEFCPICQMQVISQSDCEKYLYKKYNMTNKELAKEIRDNFSSYKELTKYLRS